ncbi:cytochrome P450 [Streptomyces albus]|uniref:cytochrome P450 n=1 Tax=Streptomyces albus TaxID=1888 RepID=UPI0004C9CE92|nr:cytochrome P450 [Streptomyces albus]
MTVQLPFEQEVPLQVPLLQRKLLRTGVIHRVRTMTGDGAWLVTGYDEVRRLLNDDRLGRSHPDPDTAARTNRSALFGGPLGNFDTEQPDHARMRSLLQPHFTPGRMRFFRPRVEALTARLLDDLSLREQPADLNTALALPLPILVICELLGVPYEDRDRFRAWTQAAADIHDRHRSEQGLGALFRYGLELVARKRRAPGDDVISRLCQVDDVGDDEAAMLAMALLFAGHETTVVQLGLGALVLLTEPERRQSLHADPARIPGAVEELLRLPGRASGGIPRYARTGFTLHGATIRTGDLVLLDNGAANHDADAFPAPDRFDPDRRGASHLTFGHGPRYCLGAPLARLELEVAFAQLISRFPDMSPAVPLEELRLRTDVLAGGLVELPVRW